MTTTPTATTSVAPEVVAAMEGALGLLRAGQVGQAIADLRLLIGRNPSLPGAHVLLAAALESSGDDVAALDELRRAVALAPTLTHAVLLLAARLTARRKPHEALEVLRPLLEAGSPDIQVLTEQGSALKALGRLDDAAEVYAHAARLHPDSGVAEHNLAGVLGDAHRFAESAQAAARALAKGVDAPEAWLVRARALQGLGDDDAAEAAFREAVRRRPTYAEAQGDLARLIWMRTEDFSEACRSLDLALAEHPADVGLALAKGRLLKYTDDAAGAFAVLAPPLAASPNNVPLLVSAALLVVADDPATALAYAERAVAVDPDGGPPNSALCQVYLALGRPAEAAAIAERLCADWPLDQFAVNLAATAWRILDDPRYRELYDYERFVRARTIDTPPGWSSLEGYLGDLAARLGDLQRRQGYPIGQSLRQGAQTDQNLTRSHDPVIAAFFPAIDATIRAYIAGLAGRDDIVSRRATEDYRFTGSWAARLRPGGYHVNHIHPMAWISSACHITLPAAVERGHEGWLAFGEPGLPTAPPLAPEHFVKPRAGDLVLFPSYMWHGTVPFGGDEPRLTVAFDVLPA